MSSEDVPVLIVGGGPVGLTMGLLLAQQGIRSMVIDRKPTTSLSPRAHVINRRTVEIYRELGLDEPILIESTRPQNMRNVVWADTLAGKEIGRFIAWGLAPDRLRQTAHLSPVRVANYPQHRLEPMLKAAADANPLIDVHFSTELVSFEDTSEIVTASVAFPDGIREVRCSYLVGADGGRSEVREALGIKFEGAGGLRTAINAFFTADLSPWMADRPGLLYLLLSPRSTGVLIGASVPTEWVFMRPLPPGSQVSLPDIPTMASAIRDAVGVPDLNLEIHDIQSWNTNALVTESYGRGRVWLAGDAAHLNSPTGGLGLNTGVQDAHGLAWRLAGLLSGWASESVLSDYERERRAVGRINIEQSLRNLHLLGLVREAVGLPPAPDAEVGAAEFAASLVQLDEDSEQGRQRRAKVQSAIDAQYEQLDALGIDLGFAYEIAGAQAAPRPEDPVRDYLPSTVPGVRLPHAWIEVNGTKRSTLDLVGRGAFTLILGEDASSWADIVALLDPRIPLRTVEIGSTCTAFDIEGRWEALRGVGPRGAILVRPDGHVAWRADRPTDRLVAVLAKHAGDPAERLREPALA